MGMTSKGMMTLSDPDARFFWKCPDVSTVVRRAFRCLDGISANSSAAFADDMHRVEVGTRIDFTSLSIKENTSFITLPIMVWDP